MVYSLFADILDSRLETNSYIAIVNGVNRFIFVLKSKQTKRNFWIQFEFNAINWKWELEWIVSANMDLRRQWLCCVIVLSEHIVSAYHSTHFWLCLFSKFAFYIDFESITVKKSIKKFRDKEWEFGMVHSTQTRTKPKSTRPNSR